MQRTKCVVTRLRVDSFFLASFPATALVGAGCRHSFDGSRKVTRQAKVKSHRPLTEQQGDQRPDGDHPPTLGGSAVHVRWPVVFMLKYYTDTAQG